MDSYLELCPKIIQINKDKNAICFYNVNNKVLLSESNEAWFCIEPDDWDCLLNHCKKNTGWESSKGNDLIYLYKFHAHNFINPKAETEIACWKSMSLLSKLLRDKMPILKHHR